MSVVASNQVFQDFLGNFYPRRLLLLTPLYQSPTTAIPPGPANSHDPSQVYTTETCFDSNVVMVLAVLLCALICSLGLNSIIRCALRCSSVVASRSGDGNSSSRLAKTGIKQKALKSFQVIKYSSELELPGLDTECIICLSEFTAGECLRLLPKCNHGFHVRCIDKWLSSHSSCPKCRHCLIETYQKIVGYSRPVASTSQSPESAQETIFTIAPSEPEGLIRDYRRIS